MNRPPEAGIDRLTRPAISVNANAPRGSTKRNRLATSPESTDTTPGRKPENLDRITPKMIDMENGMLAPRTGSSSQRTSRLAAATVTATRYQPT